jgi:hypothetical protein
VRWWSLRYRSRRGQCGSRSGGSRAGNEVDESMAGGWCRGIEVEVAVWATVTVETGATRQTSCLAAGSTQHDSSSLDSPAMELLSTGSAG